MSISDQYYPNIIINNIKNTVEYYIIIEGAIFLSIPFRADIIPKKIELYYDIIFKFT